MPVSIVPFFLPLVAAAINRTTHCHYVPSPNATAANSPGSSIKESPYNLDVLSEVPIASICNSGNGTKELECARKYIDAIDEQIAFLQARRLGYAAVAGHAKARAGVDLNDANRNMAVAEGMAQRVLKYGGSEEAGRVMGGEGCQIYVSLEFEAEDIRKSCDAAYGANFTRICN